MYNSALSAPSEARILDFWGNVTIGSNGIPNDFFQEAIGPIKRAIKRRAKSLEAIVGNYTGSWKELRRDLLERTYLIRLQKPFWKLVSCAFQAAKDLLHDEESCARALRVQEAMSCELSFIDSIAAEMDAHDSDLGLAIGEAIASLPDKSKQILTHCMLEQLSYEETAKLVGCSSSKVGNIAIKARERVQEIVRRRMECA